MRRMRQWLAPALTFLAVLLFILLPPRLSMVRDGWMLGGVYLEELSTVNELPVRSSSLEARLSLLSRWAAEDDSVIAATRVLPAVQEDDSGTQGLFRGPLDYLRSSGLLSERLLEDLQEKQDTQYDASGFPEPQAERLLIHDPADNLSASFLWLHYSASEHEGVSLLLDVDEESGVVCQLAFAHPLLAKYGIDSESLGRKFFDSMGLEAELVECSGPTAFFKTGQAGLLYAVSTKDTLWRVWMIQTYTVTDSGVSYYKVFPNSRAADAKPMEEIFEKDAPFR